MTSTDAQADRLWALLTAEVREVQALRERVQAKDPLPCRVARRQ